MFLEIGQLARKTDRLGRQPASLEIEPTIEPRRPDRAWALPLAEDSPLWREVTVSSENPSGKKVSPLQELLCDPGAAKSRVGKHYSR